MSIAPIILRAKLRGRPTLVVTVSSTIWPREHPIRWQPQQDTAWEGFVHRGVRVVSLARDQRVNNAMVKFMTQA
jgi:hypothetical protein